MDPTIQIPDGTANQVTEETSAPAVEVAGQSQPFETGYGMWAKYGPAPSIEEIDENRREMFRNFAEKARSLANPSC